MHNGQDTIDTASHVADADTSPVTPPRRAEGLYFGLSDDAYHGDIALGSGSIRALAKCPIYYWRESWMNPLREADTETPALLYGRALHCLVLEGPEEFQRRYQPIPTAADHPEALVKMDDIKAALRAVGGKLSGTKEEITERLRELDPGAVFFDDVAAVFRAMCERDRVTGLKPETYGEIVQAAAYITGDPRVRAAFQGGRPEVSIFWERDGVPLKARLDYVRLGKADGKPVGLVTDLKSFANVLELPPERAVIRAISTTRLDIQAAAYLDGIARIPAMIESGKVFGVDGVNPQWIDMLGSVEQWQWFWCFYEKGVPVSMLRSTRPGSPVIQAATFELDRALQAYRDNMEAFGTAWRFVDPVADHEVTVSDLPKWLGVQ